jgi:hypothetical protein
MRIATLQDTRIDTNYSIAIEERLKSFSARNQSSKHYSSIGIASSRDYNSILTPGVLKKQLRDSIFLKNTSSLELRHINSDRFSSVGLMSKMGPT